MRLVDMVANLKPIRKYTERPTTAFPGTGQDDVPLTEAQLAYLEAFDAWGLGRGDEVAKKRAFRAMMGEARLRGRCVTDLSDEGAES